MELETHVSVSCQTEMEIYSREEYDKIKEDLEKLKKEHHELLLKYAEAQAIVGTNEGCQCLI